MANKAQAGRRKGATEHYPAPYAIIDTWQNHNGNALAAEEEMAAIFGSATARNLVRVFFLQERLKAFGKDCGIRRAAGTVVGPG